MGLQRSPVSMRRSRVASQPRAKGQIPVLDLGEQRRLDPNAAVNDLFGVRLGFAEIFTPWAS
jgi:hypothetical protein